MRKALRARRVAGGWRPRQQPRPRDPAGALAKANAASTKARAERGSARTATYRNMADSCEAQTFARIATLREKLGRSPSSKEFIAEFGKRLMSALVSTFGTWNNAKALAGLSVTPAAPRVTKALALVSLGAWVEAHGSLPSSREVTNPERGPALPSFVSLLRAFGVDNWAAAMRSAAENLGLEDDGSIRPDGRKQALRYVRRNLVPAV